MKNYRKAEKGGNCCLTCFYGEPAPNGSGRLVCVESAISPYHAQTIGRKNVCDCWRSVAEGMAERERCDKAREEHTRLTSDCGVITTFDSKQMADAMTVPARGEIDKLRAENATLRAVLRAINKRIAAFAAKEMGLGGIIEIQTLPLKFLAGEGGGEPE